MREDVIVVEDLKKVYNGTTAIDEISFKVREGEIFSIVGPNGAGKTTTVEILECLRKPTSGSARVLGYDIVKDEEKIKQQVGVMPQEFSTFERLTAKENIKLVSDIYGKGNLDEIMREVGVEEFKYKRFMDLSGGMKTRVGIGMSMVSDPKILFLDEPTSGLDPQARKETWDLITGLKEKGKTVLLTTHYMEEVEELADRAAILIDGKIKVIDTVGSLIDRFGGGLRVSLKRDDEAEKIIGDKADDVEYTSEGEVIGIFDSKKKAREALILLYQKDYDVDVDEPGMDDVFLRMIGGKIDERGELI